MSHQETPKPREKRFSLRDAEVDHTYSIFNSVQLNHLTSLKDGQKFSYTTNVHQPPFERNTTITIKARSEEGLVASFSKIPEIGDVLIPWDQTDRLIVFPVEQ